VCPGGPALHPREPQRRPDMPEVTRMLSSTKKAVFPRRPGYTTESPIYVGDRITTTP
jgi:hypothetical protein